MTRLIKQSLLFSNIVGSLSLLEGSGVFSSNFSRLIWVKQHMVYFVGLYAFLSLNFCHVYVSFENHPLMFKIS